MPTKIEWAEESWNPVIGCSKVSPGCQNCYAERLATRLRHMEKNKPGEKRHYTKVVAPGGWNGNIHLIPDRLDQPLHWKKPRRIFVCSMGDLFHEDVPDEFIERILNDCAVSQHKFLFLTKRVERMRDIFKMKEDRDGFYGHPSIWVGATAENQREYDRRVPMLLQIQAAKLFVSMEPMLELIDPCLNIYLKDGPHPEWIILGAESGSKRRYCDPNDVSKIVGQCKAHDIPVFVKQLHINGKLSKNMAEWPENLRVREYPC